MEKNTLVFVWDDDFLGDQTDGGNIIRKFLSKIGDQYLVKMLDGKIYDFNNAIPVTEFKCPHCGTTYSDNVHGLVIGKEALEENKEHLVNDGYVGACLKCDEDFYLFELVENLKEYTKE